MNTSQPSQETKDLRWIIKSEDPLYGHYFVQKASYYLIRLILATKLPITPNQLTIGSFTLGLAAAVLFAFGDYTLLVIGVLLLNISLILDCADGQLARAKGLKSQFGAWFDYHTDKIKDGATLLGWTIGAFVASGNADWWLFVVAFVGIFFQFLRNISALNRDIAELQANGKKDESRAFIETTDNSSQFKRSLKHSMLFKLADRVMLYTVFGLLNLAVPALFIYAALAIIFASLSAFLNYRRGWRIDKQTT